MNGSIQKIPEADIPQAKRLWTACFTEDSGAFVDYYFSKRADAERMLGMYVDGGLVSMLCVIPRRIRFGRVQADAGFITGVCTLPGCRRRGYVRRLLDRANEMLASEGIYASLLQPFDVGFYERLGYKPLAERRTAEFSCGDFRCGGVGGRNAVWSVGGGPDGAAAAAADVIKITEIYERYMSGRTSSSVRTASDFAVLLGEYSMDGGFALLCEGAYALGFVYTHGAEETEAECAGPEARTRRRVECDEFAFTDIDAALRLAGALASMGDSVKIPLPVDSDFPLNAGKTEKFNMLRILSPAFYSELSGRDAETAGTPLPAPFAFDKY